MNKFELLDQIILYMDRLADAKGVERCALLANVVQMLGALKDNLTESDKAAEDREALLLDQLQALTTPAEEVQDGEERLGGNTIMFGFGGDENAKN